MATVNELKATARPRAGKGAARAVRREGRVPGVIYGDNQPPLSISLDYDELKHRIFAGRFLTSICNIEIDGKKHRTIPRDFQLDPVRDTPVHVDFLRLGEGASIRVRIPVHVKITGLEISHSKHLSDVNLPPNVRPIMHGDSTLVTIVPPSGYAEEMKAAAEAAAAAAAAAAVATEAGAAGAPGAPPAAPGAAPGAAPA